MERVEESIKGIKEAKEKRKWKEREIKDGRIKSD